MPEEQNKHLNGLIGEKDIQDIKETINKIKPLAIDNKNEEINKSITELGKYKNLIDIDRELKKILNTWDCFGISDEFYDALELFRSKINNKLENFEPIGDVFEEQFKSEKKKKGISFLNDTLNKETGGLMPGTLCTLVGGPGSMKTTAAVNISYQAIKEGYNVCYFSLEEAPSALYSKLLSRVSSEVLLKPITVSEILKRDIEEEQQKDLFEKVKPHLESRPGKLFIVGEADIAEYSCFEFENKLFEINELVKESTKGIKDNKTHEIDLVVVDHVQLLKYSSGGEDEYKSMNRFISFFRRQSLSFLNNKKEICVLLLSQVNREGIKYAAKHDGEYLMQHVAEASEIERSSSYIISVYTDAMNQITKQIKLGVLKNRNGHLPSCTFNEYADGSIYTFGTNIEAGSVYTIGDIFCDRGVDKMKLPPLEMDSLDDEIDDFE